MGMEDGEGYLSRRFGANKNASGFSKWGRALGRVAYNALQGGVSGLPFGGPGFVGGSIFGLAEGLVGLGQSGSQYGVKGGKKLGPTFGIESTGGYNTNYKEYTGKKVLTNMGEASLYGPLIMGAGKGLYKIPFVKKSVDSVKNKVANLLSNKSSSSGIIKDSAPTTLTGWDDKPILGNIPTTPSFSPSEELVNYLKRKHPQVKAMAAKMLQEGYDSETILRFVRGRESGSYSPPRKLSSVSRRQEDWDGNEYWTLREVERSVFGVDPSKKLNREQMEAIVAQEELDLEKELLAYRSIIERFPYKKGEKGYQKEFEANNSLATQIFPGKPGGIMLEGYARPEIEDSYIRKVLQSFGVNLTEEEFVSYIAARKKVIGHGMETAQEVQDRLLQAGVSPETLAKISSATSNINNVDKKFSQVVTEKLDPDSGEKVAEKMHPGAGVHAIIMRILGDPKTGKKFYEKIASPYQTEIYKNQYEIFNEHYGAIAARALGLLAPQTQGGFRHGDPLRPAVLSSDFSPLGWLTMDHRRGLLNELMYSVIRKPDGKINITPNAIENIIKEATARGFAVPRDPKLYASELSEDLGKLAAFVHFIRSHDHFVNEGNVLMSPAGRLGALDFGYTNFPAVMSPVDMIKDSNFLSAMRAYFDKSFERGTFGAYKDISKVREDHLVDDLTTTQGTEKFINDEEFFINLMKGIIQSSKRLGSVIRKDVIDISPRTGKPEVYGEDVEAPLISRMIKIALGKMGTTLPVVHQDSQALAIKKKLYEKHIKEFELEIKKATSGGDKEDVQNKAKKKVEDEFEASYLDLRNLYKFAADLIDAGKLAADEIKNIKGKAGGGLIGYPMGGLIPYSNGGHIGYKPNPGSGSSKKPSKYKNTWWNRLLEDWSQPMGGWNNGPTAPGYDKYPYGSLTGRGRKALGGPIGYPMGGLIPYADGGYVQKFHTLRGEVPGPYGAEVAGVLRAKTESVYPTDYINSLQNATMSGGNTFVVNNDIKAAEGMDVNQLADVATRRTIQAIKELNSLTNKSVGESRRRGSMIAS